MKYILWSCLVLISSSLFSQDQYSIRDLKEGSLKPIAATFIPCRLKKIKRSSLYKLMKVK